MWTGINRRAFPRAEYPCRITVRRKDQPDSISTRTENIGMGGICIIIPRDLGIFSPVEIQLDLQDGQPVVICDGTIMWIVGKKSEESPAYDTGIEFTNLKRKDADRISFIVDKILESLGEP